MVYPVYNAGSLTHRRVPQCMRDPAYMRGKRYRSLSLSLSLSVSQSHCMACDYFLIMQCIDLDLVLLTIFLSFIISLFLCSDLDLGSSLVLSGLNWLFSFCVSVYICNCEFVLTVDAIVSWVGVRPLVGLG